MTRLPDPRPIDSAPCPDLLRPLLESTTGDEGLAAGLAAQLRAALAAGDEAAVRTVFHWQGPAWLNRRVRACVQSAIDGGDDEALRLQMFALPVVLVAAGRAPAVLPLVLPETGFLLELFAGAGALGPARQVAFNAALCDAATLEQVPFGDLYRRARLRNTEPMNLPASPLPLTAGQEVALRFIVGTHLVPRGVTAFTETAGDVGRWGADVTRELSARLALPGVTLLPLARPPRSWLPALSLGRFCREEVAFQLAIGDHLRDLRARYGDAPARVHSQGGDAVAIELHSPWEDAPRQHLWRLDRDMDLPEVCDAVQGFLAQCGVTDVRFEPSGSADPRH